VGIIVGKPSGSMAAAKDTMEHLFWIQAGFAAVVLVCVLVHFPDAPKAPPSEAAAAKRTERAALKRLRNDGMAESLLAIEDGKQQQQQQQQQGGMLALAMCGRCTRMSSGRVSGDSALGTFWALALCMALPLGVYQALMSVLNLNLASFVDKVRRHSFVRRRGCGDPPPRGGGRGGGRWALGGRGGGIFGV
jgi:hypothetical protein